VTVVVISAHPDQGLVCRPGTMGRCEGGHRVTTACLLEDRAGPGDGAVATANSAQPYESLLGSCEAFAADRTATYAADQAAQWFGTAAGRNPT
jgi:hypothetical protein